MSNFRNPSPAELDEFKKTIEFNSELKVYLVALFRFLSAKKNKYLSQDEIDYLEYLLQVQYDRLYKIDPKRTRIEVPTDDELIWW